MQASEDTDTHILHPYASVPCFPASVRASRACIPWAFLFLGENPPYSYYSYYVHVNLCRWGKSSVSTQLGCGSKCQRCPLWGPQVVVHLSISPGLHFGPRFLSHTKLFHPQLGPFLGTGLVYIHISHSSEFLVPQPGWVPFFEGHLLLVAFKSKAKGHQSPLPWTQIPFPPESKRNALM